MAATLLSLRRQWHLSLAITCLFPILSAASPWIVTANYEEVVTVYPGYTDYGYETDPPETYTDIVRVTSPTASAISTSTITDSDEYNSQTYTIVEVLYPYNPTATPTTSAAYATATDDYYNYAYTNYLVNLAYTAPTSCSTTWAYTTAVTVDPPAAIESALVPTSVSTSYSVDNGTPFQATTYTSVYAYIDPTQLPSSSLAALRTNYEPHPPCYNPSVDDNNSGDTSSSSSSSSSSPYLGTYSCGYYYCSSDDGSGGISLLAIILISIFGWAFIFFVAGLFENYFYFQRLMKGWQARRGVPITWWFMVFPITVLLCLGFSRRGFQARSEEDAQELRQKWEGMGFWKKMKLWLRHGFTWGYPSILGPAPPRVGRPAKARPTQPLLQASRSASETGEIAHQPTPRTSNGNDDVEAAAVAASVSRQDQPAMSGGLSSQSLQVPPSLPERAQQVPGRPVEPIPEQDEITEAPASAEGHTGEEVAEKPVSEKEESATSLK